MSLIRYQKFVIVGTLGMPGHTSQATSVKNDVHQHSKNQRDSELLFWDITKILQTCLDTLGMPSQTYQKRLYQFAENFHVYQHTLLTH